MSSRTPCNHGNSGRFLWLLVTVFVIAAGLELCVAGTSGAETSSTTAAFPSYIGGVLDRVGVTPQLGNQIPLDLQFTNADGKPVTLRECLAGRPTILQLVYYQCPMLCRLSRDGLMGTLATINLK